MADDGTIAQQATVSAPAELVLELDDTYYPDSDGHFLPENHLQAAAIMNVRSGLTQHFDRVENVVVRGNMFVYYQPGNRSASIAPDVFVVLDHDLGQRPTYKIWEEGKTLDFALEVISPSSRLRNSRHKRALYAELGIREYFLFQPDPSQPDPRLEGNRLRGRVYEPLAMDADGAVSSSLLGVAFRPEGSNLRLSNLETSEEYVWIEEQRGISQAWWQAEARATSAVEAQRQAEATATSAVEAQRQAEATAASAVEAQRRAEARAAELEDLLRQIKRGTGQDK